MCLSMAFLETFTGKRLCWILFLKLLKETPNRCFPVNIAIFLRTASFIEIFPWLLLGLKEYD